MHNYVSGGNLQTFWGKVKNWIETNFYKKNDVYTKLETYSKDEIDANFYKKNDVYTKSEIDAKFTEVYAQLNNDVAEKEVT